MHGCDMEQQLSVTTTTGVQSGQDTVESIISTQNNNNTVVSVAQTLSTALGSASGVGTTVTDTTAKTPRRSSAPSSPAVASSPGKIFGKNVNGTSK